MKQQSKWLTTVLAVAGGVTLATSAQAQDVYLTINVTYPFVAPTTLYPNWPTQNIFVNYNGLAGLEAASTGGYGSGYFGQDSGATFLPNGNTALATNDTECILRLTVNPTATMAVSGPMFYTNYNWLGLVLHLNMDSSGAANLPAGYVLADSPGGGGTGNNYSGWGNPGNPANYLWQGSNVTITFNMSSLTNFTAYTTGSSNHLYGFNWGIDPAVIFNDAGGSAFDITLHSITFAPAPTQPPNLSISPAGTNVAVTWPDPNTNTFALYQSAAPLAQTEFSWAPWTFAPVWNNGTNTITIPPPFSGYLWLRLANTNVPGYGY
jgi:hypothetical protein